METKKAVNFIGSLLINKTHVKMDPPDTQSQLYRHNKYYQQ